MRDWAIWFFTNPVPYGCFTWAVGIGTGIIIGHSAKTRKYEVERDAARADLDVALRAIELKEQASR